MRFLKFEFLTLSPSYYEWKKCSSSFLPSTASLLSTWVGKWEKVNKIRSKDPSKTSCYHLVNLSCAKSENCWIRMGFCICSEFYLKLNINILYKNCSNFASCISQFQKRGQNFLAYSIITIRKGIFNFSF